MLINENDSYKSSIKSVIVDLGSFTYDSLVAVEQERNYKDVLEFFLDPFDENRRKLGLNFAVECTVPATS